MVYQQFTEKKLYMAFKYMTRRSPSLFREMQLKLLIIYWYNFSSIRQSKTHNYSNIIQCSWEKTDTLIHSQLTCKLLPIYMEGNKETPVQIINTHKLWHNTTFGIFPHNLHTMKLSPKVFTTVQKSNL